ncbi:MAG: hypothetical protein H0U23_03870 [Blastocatellia bacterium]|nr:hypothetical protein [Blastocatellia bacterium]
MAIFTDSKPGIGEVFPAGAIDQTWRRTEPLLTVEKLVSRHLFGIPLVSGVKDPFTGRPQVMTPDMLTDYIDRAVSEVEFETGATIFPTQFEERMPFDRCEYASHGYMRLLKRPVASIELLTISPSNNGDVFAVPTEWIDVGQLYHGQLNILPLTAALNGRTGEGTITSAGGPALLAILGNQHWLPSYWKVRYSAGFPNGMVPKVVNDLIGTVVAIEVLSLLGPTNGKNQGSSLSIDGMSQSISSPGPNIYTVRLGDLEKKRMMLTQKLKAALGLKLFSGNV